MGLGPEERNVSDGDDKLKDLKSRLGLVSSGGKSPASSEPSTVSADEPRASATQEDTASPAAPASSGSMATPTREMSSDVTGKILFFFLR